MPANYDMIISQSPPVFSHSPPAGFLTDYMSTYRRPFEPPGFSRPHHHHNLHNSHHHSHHNHHHHSPHSLHPHHLGGGGGNVQRNYLHMKSINALNIKMASAPKSCLAKHNNHHPHDQVDNCKRLPRSASEGGGLRALAPPPKPKRVVFADDRGLELTQVKIMSEPSNVPPYWTLQFLAEVTHGLISPVAITEQWVVDFKQPASDYLEFRRILDEKNVSLENVIVKESESIVVGTVKVRNLSYDKEVIVRVTYDNWKSQQDIFCTYSNLGGPPVAGAYALYDTFAFKLTLPPASKRSVEFCVCFRCNDQEYWDSHNGQNYTLSKRVNGTSGGADHDSILTNSYDAAKMNQVTTIIQDLKSSNSWNSGLVADSQRPYW